MTGLFDESRVGQAYELVRRCWEDISRMCQDWTTDDGQASESDWAYARRIYKESKLNQNRIALYDLTRGDGLSLEIEFTLLGMSNDKAVTDKYLNILKRVYKEVDRIDGRISQYFGRLETSDDLPKDRFIRQEVDFVLDAIWDIKYELYPRIQSELVLEQGNLFDGIDSKKVLRYFGQLTTTPNQKGKPYMNNFEFRNFMNRAFGLNENLPLAKIDPNDSKAVHELFYHYYKGCKDYEGLPKKDPTKTVREKYVRLLTTNIAGYKHKSVSSNFNTKDPSGTWLTWEKLFINP